MVLGWKGQVQMIVGESAGTGSGGVRAAATAVDRCTGSDGRPGVGGGTRSKTND